MLPFLTPKMARAQSSMEFFAFTGIAFITVILFVALSGNEIKEFHGNREYLLIKDLGLKLQKEVTIASAVEDGYRRSFSLPETLESSLAYSVNNTNSTVTINSQNTVFSAALQPVVGNFTKGTNTIRKIDGIVYINSDAQASSSSPSNWYSSSWLYRKKLTLLGSQVPSALTDFPVLINISDSDLASDAQGDGDDILFTSSDGQTKLSHEIEIYSLGILSAWVKTDLSSGTDTEIYMYYGYPSALNQENAADVWSSGYEAVYHLNNDVLDSTSNNRDGTNSGTSDAAGKIASGKDITPANEITFGTWSVSGQQITVQAWANFDDFDQDDPRILSKAASGSVQDHVFMLSLSGSGETYLRSRIKTGTNDNTGTQTLLSGSSPLTAGTWYLAATTYNGSNISIYKDGSRIADFGHTGDLRQNAWEIWAGNNPNNNNPNQYSMDGKLDEIRVSSIARSAGWLTAEFNNQNSPSSFYTVGAEEAWS